MIKSYIKPKLYCYGSEKCKELAGTLQANYGPELYFQEVGPNDDHVPIEVRNMPQTEKKTLYKLV